MHNKTSAAARRLIEPVEARRFVADLLRLVTAPGPVQGQGAHQRVEAFLRESDVAARLLGPIGSKISARNLFNAFCEWSDDGSLTETRFGRVLSSSALVLRGRDRFGFHYFATSTLRDMWSGHGGPQPAEEGLLIHGAMLLDHPVVSVVVRADRGGAPFSVAAIVQASMFDASKVLTWACSDRRMQLSRAGVSGWRGPVHVAYVTPFEFPIADREELERHQITCICNPHLFQEVKS
jgi:hypothetical protein